MGRVLARRSHGAHRASVEGLHVACGRELAQERSERGRRRARSGMREGGGGAPPSQHCTSMETSDRRCEWVACIGGVRVLVCAVSRALVGVMCALVRERAREREKLFAPTPRCVSTRLLASGSEQMRAIGLQAPAVECQAAAGESVGARAAASAFPAAAHPTLYRQRGRAQSTWEVSMRVSAMRNAGRQ